MATKVGSQFGLLVPGLEGGAVLQRTQLLCRTRGLELWLQQFRDP